MSEIRVTRRHALGLAGAKRVAESIVRRLQADYGGTYAWSGDTLRFKRTGASGDLNVTREILDVRLSIGLLLTPFRSQIERELQALCEEHFGKGEAKDGQASRPAAQRSRSTRSSPSHGASRSDRPK